MAGKAAKTAKTAKTPSESLCRTAGWFRVFVRARVNGRFVKSQILWWMSEADEARGNSMHIELVNHPWPVAWRGHFHYVVTPMPDLTTHRDRNRVVHEIFRECCYGRGREIYYRADKAELPRHAGFRDLLVERKVRYQPRRER